ncbi:hypothetical protein EDD18DRAFT_1336930 [Armillaria luteobubalina]|uniref:Uncharacterized protein n=1 Tax=Armillaria luteobubalina TaxID=153913 RepID=A0AA39PC37_9AGAR|nr:hypothetical protein EDD18DRAFT_1336930 [Armillaria luteobubalina]
MLDWDHKHRNHCSDDCCPRAISRDLLRPREISRALVCPRVPSQIKDIVANLDMGLNTTILSALLYGIYTGVVAVTLWAVASRNNCDNRKQPRVLVAIILVMYLLEAFDSMYSGWAASITAFTTLAWKSVSETFTLSNSPPSVLLTGGILSLLSTVLADATLIWRCWIIWGRTVLTASRGIVAYYDSVESVLSPQAIYFEKAVNWAMLYASLMLATLLWCTILIIYRILRLGGTAGRIHIYQRVIELLVESAFLYSAVLVILVVLEAHNEITSIYIEDLGIIPTMLVGRVAAGHARPDDSWSASTPGSSIRFGNHSTSHSDTEMGVGSGRDTSSNERPDLEEGPEDIAEVINFYNQLRSTRQSVERRLSKSGKNPNAS